MKNNFFSRRNTAIVFFAVFLSITCAAQVKSYTAAPSLSSKSRNSETPKSLESVLKGSSNDFVITAEHVSRVSGVKHIYLRQAINGIQVEGTDSSIHLDAQGNTLVSHNKFLSDISKTLTGNSLNLTQKEAIISVATKMNYPLADLKELERKGGVHQESLFNGAEISGTEIPVRLLYFYEEGKGTRLVWELSVQELTSSDWWNFKVDAASGAILHKDNFTVSCFNEDHDHEHEIHASEDNSAETEYYYTVENNPALVVGAYNVIPLPIESPNHGSRSLISNPDNATASPFGWHDTNGSPGAEYTYTRGNNCAAYDDDNNTNSATTQSDYAEGGGSLLFDFPFNPVYTAGNQSEDAAVTNLFYWTNIIHDIIYQYGMDEASGNFQENNYGNGGAGGDSVNSEAQDGSGSCNANFGTPPDGNNPRMQMYVCNSRDGDFDNGVIIHEFAHGISNRLTGGASTTSCLGNQEQMGEGWSDYYGLMLTMENGDTGTDSRGIGTWLIGEGASGGGIRTYPYSTDVAINPHTYDDIKTEAVPHGVGSVWCAMLWEMTWELINDHGFSTDLYTFTGDVNLDAGNVQALALVTEGLKLQPCSPGFIDGRDAILQADQNIYGGANQCAIWDAFSRRGLGYSAIQGSTGSRSDGTEAFDLPPGTAAFNNSLNSICITEGIQTGLSGGTPSGGVYSGVGVTDDGNGSTYTFDPSVAGVGITTVIYTVFDSCSGGVAALDEIIDIKDGTPEIVCQDVTYTLDASGSLSIDPFFNQATLLGGDNGSGTAGFSALVVTPTQDATISFDWNYTSNDDPAYDFFGYILGTSFFALSDGASTTDSGSFSIDLVAGTDFGFCTYTVDNTFGSATGVVTNFSPGFIGQFEAANFSEVQQNSDGNAIIDQVNFLGVVGSCGTTSLSGQTTFTCLDIGTNNIPFTVTDDVSALSSTCSPTITILPNPAQLTTFSGGSWDNGTPSNASVASFNTNYDTASFGDVVACSCLINGTSTVTINGGDSMSFEGNINVDGTLTVEHEGSLVQVDDDAIVVNNGTINVDLTTPTLASRDFMVMGSPMTNSTRQGVWNSAFLVLNHVTANFVPNAAVEAALPGAENFADDNYDNWVEYPSGAINAGEGYIVRPQSGYGQPGGVFNYTYNQGTLNNGVVNFPIVYNTGGTPAENRNASPNVLANPYASAIFADDFINANAMIDEVYFWEHLTPPSPSIPGAGSMNFDMQDISMYNLMGGTEAANDPGTTTQPNGYISTGQGFGIKAKAGGTAVFNNSMRRTTGNNTLRTPESYDRDRIWVKVSQEEYELQSQTLIGFSGKTTAGMDPGYDSRRLATILSIYSHLEDGSEQLGIQSRETFNSGKRIPLGFSTLLTDKLEYTLSIAQIEGPQLSGARVYLIDHQENIMVNLSEVEQYHFSSEEGTYHQRFSLFFRRGHRLLETESNDLEEGIGIYPNPTADWVNIASPILEIEGIRILDLQGRVVAASNEQGKLVQMNLSHLQSTVYFVEITTEMGNVTKRLVKK